MIFQEGDDVLVVGGRTCLGQRGAVINITESVCVSDPSAKVKLIHGFVDVKIGSLTVAYLCESASKMLEVC